MGTRLKASAFFAAFFCLFFTNQFVLPEARAAIDAPCPNGDADCDLCGGETCLQSGFCGWKGSWPCKLSCTTCVQNGGATTCVENDQKCDELAGNCWVGDCDANADWINDPTGCQYTYDPAPAECQACDSCGNGICEEPETYKDCGKDCKEPDAPAESIAYCGPQDYVGLPILNCNDGQVCTDDICIKEAPEAWSGTCSYQPKGCSGATQDFCCPAKCETDSASPDYDVDCCAPPASPSPSPSPIPTPPASPSPVPTPIATPSPGPEPTPPASPSPLPTPPASPSPLPTPPVTPEASPVPTPSVPPTPSSTPEPAPSVPPGETPPDGSGPANPGENPGTGTGAYELFLSGGACGLHAGAHPPSGTLLVSGVPAILLALVVMRRRKGRA